MRLHPRLRGALAAALLVSASFAGSLAYIALAGSDGVVIDVRLVDSTGAVYEPGRRLPVAVHLAVWALAPPPGGWRLLYSGWASGEVRLEAERLAPVAAAWLDYEAARVHASPGSGFTPAGRPLRVDVHVVDRGGNVLGRRTFYYTYNPLEILSGGGERLTLGVPVGADIEALRGRYGSREWFPCEEYVWRLEWRVAAEDIVGNSTSIPYRVVYASGEPLYYVATPLLVVNNYDWGSNGPPADGVFEGWVYLQGSYQAALQAVVGIGFDVSGKVGGGDWSGGLSGSITSAGPSYSDVVAVAPPGFEGVAGGGSAVVYIYARPVIEFYREYVVESELCGPGGEQPTGWEKVEVYVEDVYVYYVDPSTGVKYLDSDTYVGEGLPEWLGELEEALGLSVELQQLQIPGTPLDDGVLDPGEWVSLETIVSYLDSGQASGCEEFDASLPVGAALSLALAAGSRGAFAPLALAMPVSVTIGASAEGDSEMTGRLENSGDILEFIHAGLGGLEYRKDPPWWCAWCDPCYYRVPVAYIEGR